MNQWWNDIGSGKTRDMCGGAETLLALLCPLQIPCLLSEKPVANWFHYSMAWVLNVSYGSTFTAADCPLCLMPLHHSNSITLQNSLPYPSFSTTGESRVRCPGLDEAEMISRNWRTAWMCFSVQKALYSADMYSSLHVCWADRQLTRLPRLWIVFEMRVSVRFVWESCKHHKHVSYRYFFVTWYKHIRHANSLHLFCFMSFHKHNRLTEQILRNRAMPNTT
jgi:hypothetical protein